MAFNNNKGENYFPYEIKEAEGDVRERFIKDFHGKLKKISDKRELLSVNEILLLPLTWIPVFREPKNGNEK